MKIIKKILFNILFVLILLNCQKSNHPLSMTEKEYRWDFVAYLGDEYNEIFFIDQKTGWVVGDSGRISFTNDGGISWNNQNSNCNNKLTSVFFKDKINGWISGYNTTVLSTDDGGNTWEEKNIVSDSATIFSSIQVDRDNNVWFISNYGEIYCSTDNGENWEIRNSLNTWGYKYLFFPTPDIGYALRIIGNTLMKTTDGGLTWSPYPISMESQWSGDIFFLNEQKGWISENFSPSSMWHDSSSIYSTENGGLTWNKLGMIPELESDNLFFIDEEKGWLSHSSLIYNTLDGGRNWQVQFNSGDNGFIRDIYFLNATNGWALTYKGYVIKYCHHY